MCLLWLIWIPLRWNLLSKLAAKCYNTRVQWSYDSELNSSQTLLDVFKRLPMHLQRKFSDKVDVALSGYQKCQTNRYGPIAFGFELRMSNDKNAMLLWNQAQNYCI